MFDIRETVDSWLSGGSRVALATVVDTWGSSPRPVGAKMAVRDDMAMIGSVTGGCVEAAVIDKAIETLKDDQVRLLHYGVSDDTAWDVGLACGGKVSVFVEPLDVNWWGAVSRTIDEHHAAATLTIIEGHDAGRKILVAESGEVLFTGPILNSLQRDTLTLTATLALGERAPSVQLPFEDGKMLLEVHRPAPRLIIIGGAHVAMALTGFACSLGFRVQVIDPRTLFSTKDRFPAAETILHSYPDKALVQLGMDSETYIAVLTHDPKIDDPALRTALPGPSPYIGVLSSKRAHEQRIERLSKGGVSTELLARIHTPIGLKIGARTPEEIALCIMAEIVAVRNGVVV